MEKLNVAIADDNNRVVQLLDHIVSSDSELEVVGKAENGEELVEIIKQKEPDVVLLGHYYAKSGRPVRDGESEPG